MVDTQVASNVDATLDQVGEFGPYWVDTQKAIIVYSDGGDDIGFARTTDGGANWSLTEIETGQVRGLACWFDQETPGDTGTLVHVAWLDNDGDNAKYVTIDIDDGSVGTIRTVDSGISVSITAALNRIAITKTVSGNIIYALSTQAEIECYKSSDNFATAGTNIADPFETPTEEDWLLLYPANTGDDNDACGIFWDRSVGQISLKMYDDSGDSWTETDISGIATTVFNQIYMNMDASIRHSDNHILLGYHHNHDAATNDLKTWDLTADSIDSPTVSAKTNIFTNQSESAQVSILINQQNDDVYVAYLKGGTWLSTTDVVFHKSDDGMSTWGSETAYNETTDDYRLVHGGRTIGDDGGRVQWSWYDDDSTDIWVNLVNDIEIAADTGATYDKTFTTDSLLEATLEKTFTSDALIQNTFDKTFTVDAELVEGVVEYDKTFTCDALIQETDNDKTFTVDAWVEETFTRAFSSDAILKKSDNDKEFSLDAILVNVEDKTFSTDAFIESQDTDKTFSVDAHIEDTYEKEFSTDSILVATSDKTFDVDAYLEKQDNDKEFTTDAILKQSDIDETLTVDAILVNIFDKTFDADALLEAEYEKTFSVDSVLVDVEDKTFSVDSLIQEQDNDKTFTSDAILTLIGDAEFTADSILKKSDIDKDFTVDAWLEETYTRAFNVDAILKKTQDKTFNADAILVNQITKEFSTDALIQEQDTDKTFDADAFIQNTFDKTLSVDTILTLIGDKEFNADAILKKSDNDKTFNSDALIQEVDNDKIFTLDSFIQEQDNDKTFSVDAMLEKTSIKEFSTDALLQKSNYKTFSVDAELTSGITYDKTFTSDALLEAQQDKTFSVGAIVGITAIDKGLVRKREFKEYYFDIFVPVRKNSEIKSDMKAPVRISKSVEIKVHSSVKKIIKKSINIKSKVNHKKLIEIIDAI